MRSFTTMMTMRTWLAPAITLTLAGCAGDNLTVQSAHKPVVSADRAHVDGCPDWDGHDKDSAASTMPTYGCSTNANMAAMIFDPKDLVRGHYDPDTTADGVRAARGWTSKASAAK